MTQRCVEQVIGRLATDEEYRHRFLHEPSVTLARVASEGLELNPCELRALAALDRTALERFAAIVDPRLQKAWLARPDRVPDGGAGAVRAQDDPTPNRKETPR
jgi:hypothetical protein